VKSLGLQASSPLEVDFVTSSVGSLNDEFLRSIYLAAKGDDGLAEYTLRTAKSFPAKCALDTSRVIKRDQGAEWKDKFRVYFPLADTIKRSKGGVQNAGTICFQSRWYESKSFPKEVMRDCDSRRDGLLMHNKILFARLEQPVKLSDESVSRAWGYVGSANLSESAWGRLVQDRASKQPKLNCRNWECGVVIPVLENGVERPLRAAGNSLVVFNDTVPVPMRFPAPAYGAKKPWYYTEHGR